MDVTALTDAELADLSERVEAEVQRRYTVATAQQQVEQINEQVYTASGGDGRPWQQPTGAHDAYPLGAIVTLDGTTYKSVIPANVWPPALYPQGWEKTDPVNTPTPTPAPAWQPGMAVKVSDTVTYNGKTYACLQAHTTQAGWTPDAVPALWKSV